MVEKDKRNKKTKEGYKTEDTNMSHGVLMTPIIDPIQFGEILSRSVGRIRLNILFRQDKIIINSTKKISSPWNNNKITLKNLMKTLDSEIYSCNYYKKLSQYIPKIGNKVESKLKKNIFNLIKSWKYFNENAKPTYFGKIFLSELKKEVYSLKA